MVLSIIFVYHSIHHDIVCATLLKYNAECQHNSKTDLTLKNDANIHINILFLYFPLTLSLSSFQIFFLLP